MNYGYLSFLTSITHRPWSIQFNSYNYCSTYMLCAQFPTLITPHTIQLCDPGPVPCRAAQGSLLQLLAEPSSDRGRISVLRYSWPMLSQNIIALEASRHISTPPPTAPIKQFNTPLQSEKSSCVIEQSWYLSNIVGPIWCSGIKVKVKVKQSCYRPGVAQSVPGS